MLFPDNDDIYHNVLFSSINIRTHELSQYPNVYWCFYSVQPSTVGHHQRSAMQHMTLSPSMDLGSPFSITRFPCSGSDARCSTNPLAARSSERGLIHRTTAYVSRKRLMYVGNK